MSESMIIWFLLVFLEIGGQKMKNYLNKSTIKGIKSELKVKYGVGKSDDYAPQNTY